MYDQCVYYLSHAPYLLNLQTVVNLRGVRQIHFLGSFAIFKTQTYATHVEYAIFYVSWWQMIMQILTLTFLNVHNVGALQFLIKSTWPEAYDMQD